MSYEPVIIKTIAPDEESAIYQAEELLQEDLVEKDVAFYDFVDAGNSTIISEADYRQAADEEEAEARKAIERLLKLGGNIRDYLAQPGKSFRDEEIRSEIIEILQNARFLPHDHLSAGGRRVFDDQGSECEGGQVYYVQVDRHC
jgi:hypothetical protein